jgi:hypothetical protein
VWVSRSCFLVFGICCSLFHAGRLLWCRVYIPIYCPMCWRGICGYGIIRCSGIVFSCSSRSIKTTYYKLCRWYVYFPTLLNLYFVQKLGFSRLRKFYFRKKEFTACSEIMVCSAVWFEGFQFRPWRYFVRLIKILHVLVCPLLTCVIHLYQIRFCLFCRRTVIVMAVSLQLQWDKLFVRDNLILRTDVCRLAPGQNFHLSFLYF